MTRIVTTHYRYKPPPRKKRAEPLTGTAVVTVRTGPPAPPPPANDTGKPAPKKPTIVTTGRKRPSKADRPHLPMELPLSRKPVERDGDDYKRLKAEMTRRLRGE
jgi:hypothetical protein